MIINFFDSYIGLVIVLIAGSLCAYKLLLFLLSKYQYRSDDVISVLGFCGLVVALIGCIFACMPNKPQIRTDLIFNPDTWMILSMVGLILVIVLCVLLSCDRYIENRVLNWLFEKMIYISFLGPPIVILSVFMFLLSAAVS